jgi:hypothetical protein
VATPPPNYGRYVNSIRSDQPLGDGLNAILLPDPTDCFSWIVSGSRQIEEDTEILVNYGNQFWDTHPPPVTTFGHAPPVEDIEDQAPPGASPGTGKAFSSDPTGDGPWYHRSCHWTQYLGRDVHYTYTPDHIVLRLHRIDRLADNTDGPGVGICWHTCIGGPAHGAPCSTRSWPARLLDTNTSLYVCIWRCILVPFISLPLYR